MHRKNENNSRRKFFKKVGLGILGVSLFSFYPFRIFAGSRFKGKDIKVKIHPSAVKRNK